MLEDLVKLMVERWNMPEVQVREFLTPAIPKEGEMSLEQLREVTAGLLQDLILQTNEDQ